VRPSGVKRDQSGSGGGGRTGGERGRAAGREASEREGEAGNGEEEKEGEGGAR